MADHELKAVVLDLFDTIVKWQPERLPQMQWRERTFPSPLPHVLPTLEQRLGARFDRETFLEVYHAVVEEINAERERHFTETTCHERFTRALDRFGHPEAHERSNLAANLTSAYMALVRAVTAAPPEWSAAVRRIGGRFRLGLVSNFDDAATGRAVLSDTGVAHLFEAVIISAEVGMRKPNPKIYERVLDAMKLRPEEVLFVGDTPREDVAGPKRARMRVAWVNRRRGPLPEGVPQPDFVVEDLAALPALLGL